MTNEAAVFLDQLLKSSKVFSDSAGVQRERSILNSLLHLLHFSLIEGRALARTDLVAQLYFNAGRRLLGRRSRSGAGILRCCRASSPRAICCDGIRVNAVNHDAPIFKLALRFSAAQSLLRNIPKRSLYPSDLIVGRLAENFSDVYYIYQMFTEDFQGLRAAWRYAPCQFLSRPR